MIIEKPTDEKHIDDASLERLMRRKIDLAESEMEGGNLEGAARAFKEAAEASFELGDFEGAMRLLDRHEDAIKQRETTGPRITNYLAALQVKVNQAMRTGKVSQARDLLRQMLAIADHGHDIPAIKDIKQQLGVVQARLLGKGSGNKTTR